MSNTSLEVRAAKHAALADALRLAIVDELVMSDRAPVELRRLVGIESNLLAHHLDVLESVGMISRTKSSGDGRRRYVHLLHDSLDDLAPGRPMAPQQALFICTRNSARSQLAAALWRSITGAPADSAGTHPAATVHAGAIAAAKRAGLDITDATPQSLTEIPHLPALVVTVCDRAHEEIAPDKDWLHWSIEDPVGNGTQHAFDRAVAELRARIVALASDTAAA